MVLEEQSNDKEEQMEISAFFGQTCLVLLARHILLNLPRCYLRQGSVWVWKLFDCANVNKDWSYSVPDIRKLLL